VILSDTFIWQQRYVETKHTGHWCTKATAELFGIAHSSS